MAKVELSLKLFQYLDDNLESNYYNNAIDRLKSYKSQLEKRTYFEEILEGIVSDNPKLEDLRNFDSNIFISTSDNNLTHYKFTCLPSIDMLNKSQSDLECELKKGLDYMQKELVGVTENIDIPLKNTISIINLIIINKIIKEKK